MRIVDPISGHTYFSKRRRRFDGDMAPRELTFSCYKGFQFLARDRTRIWFIEALEKARREWSVDLWAWVLMPEHVHLLVAPREPGVAIGEFQGIIKEQVARKAIRWLEENVPEWIPRITVREGSRTRRRFWQPGGGFDRNVEKIETTIDDRVPTFESGKAWSRRAGHRLGVVQRTVVRRNTSGTN